MRSLFGYLLFAAGVIGMDAAAAESWADPDLKTTAGLVLWLDAARLPQAWQAHGKPVLVDGSALDVWYDASGRGLHLVQRVQDAQPRYVAAGGKAVVRFDGQNDCLGLARQNRTLQDFTLFLVAAPRSNAG